MNEINNFEVSPLNSLVLSKYKDNECTGHSLLFSVNFGKINSEIVLPCLDCLAKAKGRKTAPSGVWRCPLMSNFAKSAERDERVNANSITVRNVRSFNVIFVLKSCSFKNVNMTETSHVSVYRGKGGRFWNAPFRTLDTNGCSPTDFPSTETCMDAIADLYEANDLY